MSITVTRTTETAETVETPAPVANPRRVRRIVGIVVGGLLAIGAIIAGIAVYDAHTPDNAPVSVGENGDVIGTAYSFDEVGNGVVQIIRESMFGGLNT